MEKPGPADVAQEQRDKEVIQQPRGVKPALRRLVGRAVQLSRKAVLAGALKASLGPEPPEEEK